MAHPELSSPRLLLRAPRPSDVAPWLAILQEPAVARFWHGFDEARISEELASPSDDVTVLAIEAIEATREKGEGALIGAIQYGEVLDPQYRHAIVDLFLGTRWHGRGLGGEAIRALLGHLFDGLGHHRVVIDPAAHNERAIRAYERVGFRPVGVLREYERGPNGTFHDGLLMELLAVDYRAASRVKEAAPAPRPPAACTLDTATEADIPALLAMMVSFNRGEGIPWTPEAGEAPLRRLLHDPHLGWVALIRTGGAPAGYAVVTWGYDLEFGGTDAFLTEFYLVPEARGRGLGQAAMALLLAEVRARGAGALHLQVRADNIPAQRLYRAAGFTGTTRVFLSKLCTEPPGDLSSAPR